MLSLHGIFPPIPTPFDPDESIAFDRLRSNLSAWAQWPLAGYVVGGSNGEAVSLSADERVELVARARESIPADRLLIAGAGAESSRDSIALGQRMAQAGADALIVVTPHYYRPQLSASALTIHYQRIAEAAPVPVVLYNVPVYTGLDLPVDSVRQLAQHPNVIGIKESGGSVAKIAEMVSGTPEGFQVLAGSASILLPALVVGAVGCVPALGCVAAEPIHELMQAHRAGDPDRARELQAGLIGPNAAVTSRFGVAGLKAALDQIGLYGGPVRSPLQPLTEPEREELIRALSALLPATG